MNLIPKSLVKDPCQAETFEEAYRKNNVRYSEERLLATLLYSKMLEEKDPSAEDMNPEFWYGCSTANKDAFLIYEAEMKEALKRAAEKIQAMRSEAKGRQLQLGYSEVRRNWVKALNENDPTVIVYW
jgi:hypothetical protein